MIQWRAVVSDAKVVRYLVEAWVEAKQGEK